MKRITPRPNAVSYTHLDVYKRQILGLVAIWLSLTPPGPLAWVGIALLGAALHAMVPVSIVIAQELVPHRAGMAAGLMLGFSYGLGGLCTPITGYIADTYGVQTVSYTHLDVYKRQTLSMYSR